MKIARHIVLLFCICITTTAAILIGSQYFDEPGDQFLEVIFCALAFLASLGSLSFLAQFFLKRTGDIMAYLFFGFLAGLMATNFISEIVSGTCFSENLAHYALMIFFFSLSVVGIVLVQLTDKKRLAE